MTSECISIVIPVYRVEKYLARCVDSVIGQTYRNLEIILVDDGSPDLCGAICDSLAQKDSRIHVYHKENGGLSDARNFGTERASGSYITFLDSDDYIAPDYIEYLYNLVRKYDADISCCCMVKTETDHAEYGINPDIPEEQVLSGRDASFGLVGDLYMVLVTACGKLYRSEIVRKYPFPVGKKHEDEATTCKFYYESERVAVGNRCLYAYYQNPESITHSKGNSLNQDAIWALSHRAQFFEDHHEYMLADRAWRRLFAHYVQDSETHEGRCDTFLRTFKQGKMLSKRTSFEADLYNFSHLAFRAYLRMRFYGGTIKQKILTKKQKGIRTKNPKNSIRK